MAHRSRVVSLLTFALKLPNKMITFMMTNAMIIDKFVKPFAEVLTTVLWYFLIKESPLADLCAHKRRREAMSNAMGMASSPAVPPTFLRGTVICPWNTLN